MFTTARGAPGGVAGSPTPPTLGPTATSGTTATIKWTDNASNESGYLVYRVEGAVQTLVPGCSVSTPGLTTCTDSGLVPGTYYQYYVYAWNNTGVGSPATSVVAHTPKPLPAPIITDATGTTASSVTLHWQDNASDETGYTVFEYAPGGYTQVATLPANATTATLTGLTSGTIHVYIITVNRGTDLTYSTTGIWATTL